MYFTSKLKKFSKFTLRIFTCPSSLVKNWVIAEIQTNQYMPRLSIRKHCEVENWGLGRGVIHY